ncbi:histidinol dehydrogenase [Epilithonimonas ginsengisoli]|uniref:Histidinol dehydrogenase n=1 Tax=Epilithonimonas ginsengisoli TaxID=1245592 RepID=A0ABU4JCW3_9FLAO|nr:MULTISPECIES: histidinol dehydrogenase [Chryseobacterium group]MBV6878245.1 histidinol dehydrogenase [Epilithonimonas sp. FP105]MDW8547514.1 histidinol dehydrogenase [Epilithonimonas ginsengisoli]OAH69126.1 histidinol dehydrogenase [Chryseobacterium sp. FP211-J200]
MKQYKYPNITDWKSLCERPLQNQENLSEQVKSVFNEVKIKGDKALKLFTEKFDGVFLNDFKVSETEIEEAKKLVSDELKSAIETASENIRKFHISQQEEKKIVETTEGVFCWRESRAIENIGIYIPGGTAPLFSTVLMLGIPANIAGCKNITLCSPPDENGKINPAILFAADLVGIKNIFKVGGSQAIAALSFGTETITKVDKIFGPGNQYVTFAKQLALNYNVAIDIPAGPSEVLVIADESSIPSFVASDLLSQAEHGTDSQVILLSDSETIINEINVEIDRQLKELPRNEIAEIALQNSKSILLNSIDEAIEFSNFYAPEHLILSIENAENFTGKITNAGSVFLGNYSPESAGDYASGTNHTLPTNGFAKNYSGVSLDSFVKKITFQNITKNGIKNIGKTIELMAEAEELIAHKNAVSVRLKYLENEN